jgi:hypothetical protein
MPDEVSMRERQYYFREGSTACIDVMRLGDCTEKVIVEYCTTSCAMKSSGSDDYNSVKSGELVLEPGHAVATIRIPLTQDKFWETIENFDLVLVRVLEGHGQLGHGTKSTVYIVDDDVYPENFERPPSPWRLYWGFIKERWRHRHPKPLKAMFFLFYGSVHAVVATIIPKTIVDECILAEGLACAPCEPCSANATVRVGCGGMDRGACYNAQIASSISSFQSSFQNSTTEIASSTAAACPAGTFGTLTRTTDVPWGMLWMMAGIFLLSNLIKWWSQVKFMDLRGNSGTRKVR